MGTWTITTTTTEDDAINYAYQQAQKPPMPGLPPSTAAATVAAFFQERVQKTTVAPMVSQYQSAKNVELVSTFATIPEANRPAAQKDIEAVVVEHGGTVTIKSAPYLWSTNTAAPPRNNSIEADVNDANLATLTKLTFHYLDADNVNQMNALMALEVNALIHIEDATNPANFLQTLLKAPPIQRQGANGYAEMSVTFQRRGGSFAALDTKKMTVTFN
jgi:hypothetical protein